MLLHVLELLLSYMPNAILSSHKAWTIDLNRHRNPFFDELFEQRFHALIETKLVFFRIQRHDRKEVHDAAII
jgi:hypothetical protein